MDPGDFFGTNIENAGRGYILPGTTGPATPGAHAVVEFVGLNELLVSFANLPKWAFMAVGNAMRDEMEGVIQLAKDYYVPVDTGQLSDSGKVRGPIYISKDVLEVWGSFGPVANPRGSLYAIPVHEIPEPPATSVGGFSARHEFGSWKFLQIPFLVRSEGMLDRIAANAWDYLGQAVG